MANGSGTCVLKQWINTDMGTANLAIAAFALFSGLGLFVSDARFYREYPMFGWEAPTRCLGEAEQGRTGTGPAVAGTAPVDGRPTYSQFNHT